METIVKGIEKLVFRLDINTYESEYDYARNILTVSGREQIKDKSDYLMLRDNTIKSMLLKGAKVEMFIDGIPCELPKFEKVDIANYRPQARLIHGGTWQGIQGKTSEGLLALGGNIINQYIFWDVTKEDAEKRLTTLKDSFGDKYEFRIVKC